MPHKYLVLHSPQVTENQVEGTRNVMADEGEADRDRGAQVGAGDEVGPALAPVPEGDRDGEVTPAGEGGEGHPPPRRDLALDPIRGSEDVITEGGLHPAEVDPQVEVDAGEGREVDLDREVGRGEEVGAEVGPDTEEEVEAEVEADGQEAGPTVEEGYEAEGRGRGPPRHPPPLEPAHQPNPPRQSQVRGRDRDRPALRPVPPSEGICRFLKKI